MIVEITKANDHIDAQFFRLLIWTPSGLMRVYIGAVEKRKEKSTETQARTPDAGRMNIGMQVCARSPLPKLVSCGAQAVSQCTDGGALGAAAATIRLPQPVLAWVCALLMAQL